MPGRQESIVNYRICVDWLRVGPRGKYSFGSSGLRSYRASSLCEACDMALTKYKDKLHPRVSLAWLEWPQKGAAAAA